MNEQKTHNHLNPAIVFHPGLTVLDMMKGYNMSKTELAEVINYPLKELKDIISCQASITKEFAKKLAYAFGTSVNLWLKLQNDYDIYRAEQEMKIEVGKRKEIERRYRVFRLKKEGHEKGVGLGDLVVS